MPNSPFIEVLQKEMQEAACDVRAEAQLLMAFDRGLWPEHFMVSCNKRFKREYSKDVVLAEIKEDAAKQNLLHIQLSRSGIYDQLPEGLFFQSSQREKRNNTVASMATDYKTNKKKEEDIRRFFQPFENDFFLQRIWLEQEETSLLEGLQAGNLTDYFIQFWNLPVSIPKKFISPLILLLPHVYKISGDLRLTAQSLHQILGETVHLKKRSKGFEDARMITPPVLGDSQLGLNMVCGDTFLEDTPLIEIEIGPLQSSQVSDYLEGGNRYILMETIIRFFIPVGIETILSIKVPADKQHMVIERGAEPVLGHSSCLV